MNDDILLEKLNRFTRRNLSADEVYIFPVTLCDNEVDRDCEKFSDKALSDMATLFIGVTGIFDHNAKGANQTARIFETELITDDTKSNSLGEKYKYLKAYAYMVRTDANKNLISEIEGGIKKEVSVSCAAGSQVCSVCGSDTRKKPCCHSKGKMYGDKLCYIILDGVTDAYEWSFVAVPAQKNAGVTKQFGGRADISSERDKVISECRADVCNEVTRLAFNVSPMLDGIIKNIADKMSLTELINLKKSLRKQLSAESKRIIITKNDSQNNISCYRIKEV